MNRELLPSIANALAESTKAYLAPVLSAFADRIAVLEDRMAHIKDGANGRDGTDADVPALEKHIDLAVARAVVAAVQAYPWDTLKGEKGDTGLSIVGPPGPQGERGLDGAPGRDGRDGLPGVPGLQGEKGADGINGRDGVDGQNGLGLDDIQVEHDGKRTFTFKFINAYRTKSVGPFIVPAPIYGGIWKKDEVYVYQDVVKWARQAWICTHPTTTAEPGAELTEPKAWEVFAARGNDGPPGKEGPQGKAGPRGPQGEPGGRY